MLYWPHRLKINFILIVLEKKLSSENNQLSSENILGLLPHRYPFALVDKVIEHIPGERAVAVKNVTINEPQFQGHFPERPLMPGVLIVESVSYTHLTLPTSDLV